MDADIGSERSRAAPADRRRIRIPSTDVRQRAAHERERWETAYLAATVGADVLAISVAVVAGSVLGFGTTVPSFGEVAPAVGILAGALMVVALVIGRAWDPRILGHGSEEFSRLVRAVVVSAVALGLLGLALEALAARPWVFGLMPLAGAIAVLGRLVLRARLHRLRLSGRCALPVLVVGTPEAAIELIDRTRRDPTRGWQVTGVCTPTGDAALDENLIMGVPVLGDLDSVPAVARTGRHRVVAVCPTPGLGSKRLHMLAWSLEGVGAELVVDPGLMEVAGPRLHVEPVDGIPLLRLTRPTFSGVPWVVKQVVDRVGAAGLLMLTAPLLLALSMMIKLDGGPVFFRQRRVGRHGREFTMLKFRSMVVDAESMLGDPGLTSDGAGPLFKMRRDPRITRVGRVIRRYSLDELPQLLNVVFGSMSLVGPRPPLPSEAATYGQDARRRLMVRPGLTGLWQISGRSDLSWEQSVRLDLRYVENWNLALDALILCRTVGAVALGRGAY